MQKILKRMLISSLAFWVICYAVLYIYSGSWEKKIKSLVEQKGAELTGGTVQVNSVKIKLLPPRMQINDVEVKSSLVVEGKIKSIEASFQPIFQNLFSKNGDLGSFKIKLFEPSFLIRSVPQQNVTQPSQSEDPAVIQMPVFPRDFKLNFDIENGNFKYVKSQDSSYSLENINFSLNFSSINKKEFSVDLQGLLTSSSFGEFKTKVKLEAKEFKLNNTELKTEKLMVGISGIFVPFIFLYDLSSGKLSLNTKSSINLTQLKTPPDFLLEGKWRGDLNFNVNVSRDTKNSILNCIYDVTSNNIVGDVLSAKHGLKGRVALLSDLKGVVRLPPNESFKLQISNLNLKISGTHAELIREGLFQKPGGVKFIFDLTGQGDHNFFNLKKGTLVFDKLVVKSHGQIFVDSKKTSIINVKIDKTNLKGFERFFPHFSDKSLDVNIDSEVDILGSFVDFKTLKFKPNLNLELQKVDISNLIKKSTGLAKSVSNYVNGEVGGRLSGVIKLTGEYDQVRGIENSPIALNSKLSFHSPSIKLKRKTQDSSRIGAGGIAKSSPIKEENILPNWPIFNNSISEFNISIDTLNYGSAAFEKFNLLGVLNGIKFNGSLKLENIFSGKLNIDGLQTSIATNLPDIKINHIKALKIDVLRASEFYNPSWKNLVRGSLSFEGNAYIPNPGRDTFFKNLKSGGVWQVRDGFLSTQSLDEMVNKKIMMIPGLGDKSLINSKGVAANFSSEYLLENSLLKLKDFIFSTPEKNEIKASGYIGLDKSLGLEGNAYLANAPIGGAIKAANSDGFGRLVVPVKISGDLTNPEINLAQETIQKLLTNTANKELDKLKNNATKAIENEAKKHFGEGVDKLKNDLKKMGLPF